jgi:hypothetical protein
VSNTPFGSPVVPEGIVDVHLDFVEQHNWLNCTTLDHLP